MITIHKLTSATLKAALIPYLNERVKPTVKITDGFAVDADGNVTVTVTTPDDDTPVPVTEAVPTVFAPLDVAASSGVSVVVAPLPGHMVTVDPPFSATGIDTEFGYKDPGDNGQGFFIDPATGKPYDTNNDKLIGISLPREVLLSTFGISDEWRITAILEVWKHYANAVQAFAKAHKITANVDGGGKSLREIPLVDAGPTRSTGNLVDLTDAASTYLKEGGKSICTFELLKDGVPMKLCGIDFMKGTVG